MLKAETLHLGVSSLDSLATDQNLLMAVRRAGKRWALVSQELCAHDPRALGLSRGTVLYTLTVKIGSTGKWETSRL